MAVVQLRIGGSVYAVSCGDGQEKHLESLAEKLDEKVKSVKTGGFVPENLALVMAGLLLANDAQTARQTASAAPSSQNVQTENIQTATRDIEKVIKRISALAQMLENA